MTRVGDNLRRLKGRIVSIIGTFDEDNVEVLNGFIV